MTEVVKFLVENLVENKDAVTIEEKTDNEGLFLHVFVAPEDLGRVVGKSGKVANSIRTIARAVGNHSRVRVTVKFDSKEE